MKIEEVLVERFSESTLTRIADRAKQGIKVWRGWKKPGQAPADPGDLGAGTYYSTMRVRAKSYGDVKQHELKFANPLVLDVKEAYKLADRYGTVKGKLEDRKAGALQLTRDMRKKGHDGLIAVSVFRDESELEIVDYRSVRIDEATKEIPPDDDPLEQKVRWKGSIIPYFIEDDGTLKMLFIKAANPDTYGHEPQIVKGRDDPKDKTPRDTAMREGGEELGLNPSALRRTEFVIKRHLSGRVSSYDIHLYVAKMDKSDIPTVFDHDAEVTDVVFMTPEEFAEYGRPNQKQLVADAVKVIQGK